MIKIILLTLMICQPLTAMADGQKTFERIISLYPAHSENLVSLGAADQLMGISISDNWPPAILDKPRFSYRDGPEKFIAADPDLVLVRPMIERSYPQLLSRLRQAGITVISLQPTGVTEIFPYWQELGKLTGRHQEAGEMIRSFRQDLNQIAGKIALIPRQKRPLVYFESIHKKMKTFAPASIAMFVLEQAGGINAAEDAPRVRNTNIAAYGKERILARPQIDIFLAQQGRMNPVSVEMIRNEPGFGAIKAVRQGRIYLIDEYLVSRPTMRIITGIRQLAAILHPEIEAVADGH